MNERRNHKENWKYSELNDNENTTYQNFWGTSKVLLKEKFVALSSYS